MCVCVCYKGKSADISINIHVCRIELNSSRSLRNNNIFSCINCFRLHARLIA